MIKVLIIIQIVVSVSLAVSILLQNRGAGLSSTFGGDFGGYYTKRGFEKFLYWSSVVLGLVFIVMAALIAYISARSA
jgi:preprotein translocase subunit SecG